MTKLIARAPAHLIANDHSVFVTIAFDTLAGVTGGFTAGAKLTLPGGAGAEGNVDSGPATPAPGPVDRHQDFLNCMNDRQAHCGTWQSAKSCQAMAVQACAGLPGSPSNPIKK